MVLALRKPDGWASCSVLCRRRPGARPQPFALAIYAGASANEKGFAGGLVTAIAQTTDGYLWIGTEKGVRFDGLKFRPFQQATPPRFPSVCFSNLSRMQKEIFEFYCRAPKFCATTTEDLS
jgi:hypothetical protein